MKVCLQFSYVMKKSLQFHEIFEMFKFSQFFKKRIIREFFFFFYIFAISEFCFILKNVTKIREITLLFNFTTSLHKFSKFIISRIFKNSQFHEFFKNSQKFIISRIFQKFSKIHNFKNFSTLQFHESFSISRILLIFKNSWNYISISRFFSWWDFLKVIFKHFYW